MLAGYATEYGAIFLLLLMVAYLVPAGGFYWILYVRYPAVLADRRIQSRRNRPGDIRREVQHSLLSLSLFSLYALLLFQVYKSGGTAIYWDLGAYPLWWTVGTFLLALVLHDFYFYWTHRVMHTEVLFPLFHAGHHKSITPTPWAILSFQPLETGFQFGFFALLIYVVPMHPAVLLGYLFYDSLVNAAGHCGYELIPPSWRRHRFLKYLNAVTHHDLHHTRFSYNFGQYFNVWDRMMGTFLDRAGEGPASAAVHPQGRVTDPPETPRST